MEDMTLAPRIHGVVRCYGRVGLEFQTKQLAVHATQNCALFVLHPDC